VRICNGPKLVVPRPGIAKRERWSYWNRGYGHGARDYDQYLALERARIRALPSVSVADRKRPTVPARRVRVGDAWRMVDGHGRSYGKRFTSVAHLPPSARVRVVNRQPEDYHSLISRMLKRAHRAAQ